MSKARKRHRQPWWKNRRKARLGRAWLKFSRVLNEVFPRGYACGTVDIPTKDKDPS